MRKVWFCFLILLVLISGCTRSEFVKADDSLATSEGISELVNASNEFGINFYQNLTSEEDGNVFFSPYSLFTALGMTYEGAREDTAEQINSVFHFPENDTVRRSSMAGVYNNLNEPSGDYELSTANAFWVQESYPFLDEYVKTIEDYYRGNAENVDFVNETEETRNTINNWVEKETNNKIQDLIPKGVLDSYTRFVLTNAVYFKGEWVEEFDESDTEEENFTTGDGVIKVPMMERTGEEAVYNYTETEELQVLEMNYKGNELSMLVLLPEENNTLDSIEESLALNKLIGLRNNLSEERVNLHFPKFKFETKYYLKDLLSSMGMPEAFTSNANLSGFDGSDSLFISEVIHQAFVEVNEEGTEAAAATGVIGATSAAPVSYEEFRANHPFIFLIQEKNTGNVLFMGRVMNPLE